MIIGLDHMGVYADPEPRKLVEAQALFPELYLEAPRDVLRSRLLPRVGREKYDRLAANIGRVGMLHYPFHPDAASVTQRWQREGHRPVVITTTDVLLSGDLWLYFAQHGVPVFKIRVVASDNLKIGECRKAEVGVFVDDNQSVLQLLRPLAIPLIWANFYEDDTPVAPGIIEVHSWLELSAAVARAGESGKA